MEPFLAVVNHFHGRQLQVLSIKKEHDSVLLLLNTVLLRHEYSGLCLSAVGSCTENYGLFQG